MDTIPSLGAPAAPPLALSPGEICRFAPVAPRPGVAADWGRVRADIVRLGPDLPGGGCTLRIRPAWHTVLLVLEGTRGALELPGGGRAELRPGRLDAVPAHHELRGRLTVPAGAATGPAWLVLRIDPALDPVETPAPWTTATAALADLRDQALRGGVALLRRELETPAHPEPVLLASAVAMLVLARLRAIAAPRPAARRGDQPGLVAWRLRRAMDFATANIGEPGLTVERLAEAAGLTAWHFARAFKASMGVPPHRWLLEQRVAEAQRLLCGEHGSLAEVALAVGLSSQSHLSVVFRRATGISPGAFRAARREARMPGGLAG